MRFQSGLALAFTWVMVGVMGAVCTGVQATVLIQTFTGTGDYAQVGTAAWQARQNFLGSVSPSLINSRVYATATRQDNYNCTTLSFGNYRAGTGAYLPGNIGGTMQAALNAGSGFIFNNGSGLDLAAAGLTSGMMGTTMGCSYPAAEGDPRFANIVPGFFANRGGVVGLAPISGSTGAYTLRPTFDAFGVSLGEFDGSNVTLYFFDPAGGFIQSIIQPMASAPSLRRAYVGVLANAPLGAVLINSGSDGFQLFDFAVVPEPASLSLLALGGLALLKRQRKP